jgi:tape measure domain-containing protein|nr:MAG TPA: tail tape measure protein [Caudoviricetes sp.]
MAYDGTLRFDTSVDTSGFQKDANKLGGIVKGLGVFKLLEKGFQAVASSIDGAVSRYDTLNKFPKVLQQMGYGADEANSATQKLSEGVNGLPTKLDSVVATAQRLTVLTGNLEKSTDTTLALNNAFLASGSSFDDAERGLDQYIKMLSTGKVDQERFSTLQETMGFALQRTAEAFGYAGESAQNDLYDALKSGEITFDQFNSKIIQLNNGVGGFAELAKTSSGGVRTAWTNLKTAMVRGTTEIISSIDSGLSETRFKSIENVINSMKDGVYKALTIVAKAFGFVAANAETIIPILITAGAVVAAWKIGSVLTGVREAFRAAALQVTLYAGAAASGTITSNAFAAGLTAQEVIVGLLTGKIGLVTVAQWVWNAAMAANPIGLIIAGIVALIAIVGGLIAIFGRSSAAYNEEKEKLKEVREEQENYASALRETQSEARKDAQEKMTQAQQNRVLLETLADLVNENGKCKGSLEDVRRAVNDVNSNIDGLGVTLDETTGCINMSSEALKEYGKNLEAVAKYEAAQDQYNIMLKERSEQQAKLNALKEQEAIYNQMFYDEKINRKELNALIDETNEHIKEQEKIMSGLEVEVESYERAMKNAYNSEEIIAERRTRIFNGQSALVAQYAHQYGLSFEQILNEASKMEGGLEEWQEKIAGRMTESGMDVGMLAKKWGMTAQEVDAYCTQWGLNYDEFNALMKTMHTEAGEDVDALASIWGVSANEIREWIAMNGSDVQGWSDMMEKAWDEYEQTVKDRTSGVINSFEEIPKKHDKSAKEMLEVLKNNKEQYARWEKNMEEITRKLGPTAAEEFGKLGPEANSAMEEILGSADLLDEYRSVFGVKVDEATGNAVEAWEDPEFIGAPADAISRSSKAVGNDKTLPAAAQNKVRETKTAMSEAVQSADFLSIGKAIMDGIITAMDGKATALYAKARQIANRVAGTMRDALAVRSPSRVMIDIYSDVMMGVYKGMEGMEGRLYRKADSISIGIADRLRIDPRAVTSLAGRVKTLTQMNPLQINTPVYAAAGAPGSINYSTSLTQHITSPTPLSPSRITQEAQDLLKRSKWLLP